MKKMNKEVQKIYEEALAKSYYLENFNKYWTEYFISKGIGLVPLDENLDEFYKQVRIASHKLYEKKLAS